MGSFAMEETQELEKMTKMSPETADPEACKPYKPIYKRRKCKLCCCACLAILLSLAIVVVALSQTIFKFRDPKISLHDVRAQNFSVDLSTLLSISLSADVRVENPNHYDFKYTHSELAIIYHGERVGVGDLGTGTIRSRRTVDLPAAVTVEVLSLLVNSLQDIFSGVLTLNVKSVLSGRVDVAHVYKHHVTDNVNCTVDVFIANQTLKQRDCSQSMKL